MRGALTTSPLSRESAVPNVTTLSLSLQVTLCYLALMTWVQRALAMWSPSAS